MEQNKIEIRDMNLYYGDFHALHDIDLDIKANEITAFIGPSGCVKSLADHTDLVSDPVGDEKCCCRSCCSVENVGELLRRNSVVFTDITEYVSVDSCCQTVVYGTADSKSPGSKTYGTAFFEALLSCCSQSEASA